MQQPQPSILVSQPTTRAHNTLLVPLHHNWQYQQAQPAFNKDVGVLACTRSCISFKACGACLQAEDISAEIIMEVRTPTWWMGQADCGANATTWTGARDSFLRVPVDVDIGHCDQLQQRAQWRPMESWCPLFARKFAANTADKLVGLFGNQEDGNVAIYKA